MLLRKLLILSIVALAAGSGIVTDTAQASKSNSKTERSFITQIVTLQKRVAEYQIRIAIHKDAIQTGFEWKVISSGKDWEVAEATGPANIIVHAAGLKTLERLVFKTKAAIRVKFDEFNKWKTAQRALLYGNISAWLCIHSYEGAWTDDYPPFWGGLQMDLGFQQTYGSDLMAKKGTANNWTPMEQIMVAQRAARSRGYWPWPNTAHYCGLL